MSRADLHRRAADLFIRACRLKGSERERFIDRECGDDLELRREVISLLAHDAGTSTNAHDNEADQEGAGAALTGSLGPYSIIRLVARGGMGEVYEARQENPARRVALKVIRADLNSRQVLARFETEKQALALMHHPNIAAVYEASIADDRPYVVMEFVDGRALTEHCDAAEMGIRERIMLFLQVCAGVRHAHQKGIIHRDLKPSNILVSEVDGVPVPKVIDFGIAKALERSLTGDTEFETQMGILVGTLEYMSPEQASGGAGSVDTRADVYALGVILHELLAGTLPFAATPAPQEGLEALLRRIRTEEASPPSTRFQTLDESERRSLARSRASTSKALAHELRGDLDWIVLKALEKDPERRFSSVADLQGDLTRFLNHEPVTAGPPGSAYRLRKFVQRHRLGLGLATVFVALVIISFVSITYQLRIQQAERLRAERAMAAAQAESRTRGRVIQFMQRVFSEARLDRVGPEGNLQDALRIAAEDVLELESAHDEPEVLAAVHESLGIVYRDYQGSAKVLEGDPARDHLQQALALRRKALGDSHPDVGSSYLELANLAFFQGRYDEADELARRAIDIFRSHPDVDPRRLATTLNTLGLSLRIRGRLEEAAAALKESVELQESLPDPSRDDRANLASSQEGLAGVYRETGEYELAESLMRRVLQTKTETALQQGDGGMATAAYNLAVTIDLQGRHAEAEPLFRQTLAWEREANGGEVTPWVSITVQKLGACLEAQGRYEEAAPLVRQALGLQRGVEGLERFFSETLVTQARLDLAAGLWREAEAHAAEALDLMVSAIAEDHPGRTVPLLLLGRARAAARESAKAEVDFREALQAAEAGYSSTHPTAIDARATLAEHLASTGALEEADTLSRRALEDARATFAATNPALGWVLMRRGAVLSALGHPDEAEEAFAAAETVFTEANGPDHVFAERARSARRDARAGGSG